MVPAVSLAWAGLAVPVVIALCGGVFALYKWKREAFKPAVEALLAVRGDSLRITVTNDGRGKGTVHGLDVLDPENVRVTLCGAGDTFQKFTLANGSAEVFDFNAPENRDFGANDTVVVCWGKHEKRVHPLPAQTSFYDKETLPGARIKRGAASAPAG